MYTEEGPLLSFNFLCPACGLRFVMTENELEVSVALATSGTDLHAVVSLHLACLNEDCEGTYEYRLVE